MKKAFTLFETLIVIFIVGVLSVSLIEAYTLIWNLSFEIEQDKNLTEESMIFQQTMQTISENSTIDFEKYGHTLSGSSWITGVLYLTWGDYQGVSIYSTWNCDFRDFSHLSDLSWCQFVMNKNDHEIPLIDTSKVFISQVQFKIMPFDSLAYYYYDDDIPMEGYELINSLNKPSFTLSLHFYSPFCQSWNNMDIPLEIFFNTNDYLL